LINSIHSNTKIRSKYGIEDDFCIFANLLFSSISRDLSFDILDDILEILYSKIKFGNQK
jgi:hypothetical protein